MHTLEGKKLPFLRINYFLILIHIYFLFSKFYTNQIALEINWIICTEEMRLLSILTKEVTEQPKTCHFQGFHRIFWHAYKLFNRLLFFLFILKKNNYHEEARTWKTQCNLACFLLCLQLFIKCPKNVSKRENSGQNHFLKYAFKKLLKVK